MNRILIIAALFVVPLFISAQRQQQFHKDLAKGNYSGICALGDGRYAMVDDKAQTDGFRLVHITIDSIRQRITASVAKLTMKSMNTILTDNVRARN